MKSEDFWNSTMHEICVYMEIVRNKEECRLRDLHYLAALIRIAVVSAFNPDVKILSYDELISGRTSEEKSNIYTGWEDSKAYMKALQEVRK